MENEEGPRWLYYPTLLITDSRGIIPNIKLPADFKELVPKFYAQKRMKDVENYRNDLVKFIENSGTPMDITLNWDDALGLKNIGLGIHGGLDLVDSTNPPTFREHNLGFMNSFYGTAIATRYVYELLQSE